MCQRHIDVILRHTRRAGFHGQGYVTFQGQPSHDPSPGGRSIFTRRKRTHERVVMHGK